MQHLAEPYISSHIYQKMQFFSYFFKKKFPLIWLFKRLNPVVTSRGSACEGVRALVEWGLITWPVLTCRCSLCSPPSLLSRVSSEPRCDSLAGSAASWLRPPTSCFRGSRKDSASSRYVEVLDPAPLAEPHGAARHGNFPRRVQGLPAQHHRHGGRAQPLPVRANLRLHLPIDIVRHSGCYGTASGGFQHCDLATPDRLSAGGKTRSCLPFPQPSLFRHRRARMRKVVFIKFSSVFFFLPKHGLKSGFAF